MSTPPRRLAQPLELTAMVGRLARADAQQKVIADEGKKLDAVQDAIDARIAEVTGYRGDLEEYHNKLKAKIDGMVAGSNHPPEGLEGNDGGASPSGKQEIVDADQVSEVPADLRLVPRGTPDGDGQGR